MSDPLTARLYTYLPYLATLLLTGVKLLPKYRVVWCWCMPDRIWADFSQEIIALPAISLVTALTVWIPLATHSPVCLRPARHTLHCNKGSCYNRDVVSIVQICFVYYINSCLPTGTMLRQSWECFYKPSLLDDHWPVQLLRRQLQFSVPSILSGDESDM